MVNHPVFSKVYIWSQSRLEQLVGDHRRRQNQLAGGKTLILGAGTGLDVPYLSEQVTEVTLLEPDASMYAYLRIHYPTLSILQQPGEQILSEEQQFDTVLSSLVLCSVSSVEQVLTEVYRVLKPGGQYLFMEHVKHDAKVPQSMQNAINPLWKRVAGGCNLNRDIQSEIKRSQLTLVDCKPVRSSVLLPIITGRALRESEGASAESS